jgi:cysteine desulfurase
MQQRGWDVTYLPVQQDGLIDLAQLEAAIRPDTALVSVMYVNNEIGVLSPEIRRPCHTPYSLITHAMHQGRHL